MTGHIYKSTYHDDPRAEAFTITALQIVLQYQQVVTWV